MSEKSQFITFARFLGRLRPELYDLIFPHGPIGRFAGSIFAQPGDEVSLNPQPLPPREIIAMAIADTHLAQVVQFANGARLLGEEAGAPMQAVALRMIAEIDDLCPPFFPRWPKRFPPPPPWPPVGERMEPSEMFLAGSRFLLAADMVEHAEINAALTGTGLKLMETAMQDADVSGIERRTDNVRSMAAATG